MDFTDEQLNKLGFTISEEERLISLAFQIIHKDANTKCQFFTLLAATNFLNACVKKEEYKKKISYSFKNFLAKKLIKLIEVRNLLLFDSIHYEDNCFYIRCYNLHFSFHNLITDNTFIMNFLYSGIDSGEIWDGIKLQQHSSEIFKGALKISKFNREEDRILYIDDLKKTIVKI